MSTLTTTASIFRAFVSIPSSSSRELTIFTLAASREEAETLILQEARSRSSDIDADCLYNLFDLRDVQEYSSGNVPYLALFECSWGGGRVGYVTAPIFIHGTELLLKPLFESMAS